jgi:peptidyl-prolyl cis-trans isomerase C
LIEKLKKIAREPLLHFLLIGAGIYGLYGLSAIDEAGNDERIVNVTSGKIQSLTDQFMKMRSRPPTELELTGVISDYARTQVLYREALAMGLDKGDLVQERRLARKLESMAKSLITPEEPSDEVLLDWYAANAESFKQPDLYTVTQIFFDPDKRERTTLEDAQAALDRLKSLEHIPPDFSAYGDRIMLRNHYSNLSQVQIGKLFGTSFAEQVVKLEPGVWHGPILSGYGLHLVLLNEVLLVPPPAFEEVKKAVRDEWMAEQITEPSERFIEGLLSRYEIVVEETEVPISVPGARSTP